MLTCDTNGGVINANTLFLCPFHSIVPDSRKVETINPFAICTGGANRIPSVVLCQLCCCQWHLVWDVGVGSSILASYPGSLFSVKHFGHSWSRFGFHVPRYRVSDL